MTRKPTPKRRSPPPPRWSPWPGAAVALVVFAGAVAWWIWTMPPGAASRVAADAGRWTRSAVPTPSRPVSASSAPVALPEPSPAARPGDDTRPPDTRPAPRPTGAALTGHLRVVDGDTIALDGRRIRLLGLDAPESTQSCGLEGQTHPCGDEAREHLEKLVGDRPVTCEATGTDRYGRALARCHAGDTDLNAAMVRDGWAVAYGGYQAEEADARGHGRGLWSGSFVWPQDYRRSGRARDDTAHTSRLGDEFE